MTELLAAPGLRVERIVSTGQASPPGLWYDQDRAEWVLVLSGSAGLLFEGEDGPRVLGPGDHVLIPARARRRSRHSPGLRVELLTEGDPHGKPVWAGQGGDGVGHRVP